MALTMRGFTLMPKITKLLIPSCKSSYQHKATIMLQTHHDRMHARNISHSIICGAKRPEITPGSGGQINGTTTLREQNVTDLSSSKSDQKLDGKKSEGDVSSASPKKTASSNFNINN